MPVTSFVQHTVYDWTISPAKPKVLPAPTPEDLSAAIHALKKGRRRCRKILARLAPASAERERFERRAGRILAKGWTEPRPRKGRKPDAKRQEKMEMVHGFKCEEPAPTWNVITERVNRAFGTEYIPETLRQYYTAWRRENPELVA